MKEEENLVWLICKPKVVMEVQSLTVGSLHGRNKGSLGRHRAPRHCTLGHGFFRRN